MRFSQLFSKTTVNGYKNMKVTNVPEANEFIQPGYREGVSISL